MKLNQFLFFLKLYQHFTYKTLFRTAVSYETYVNEINQERHSSKSNKMYFMNQSSEFVFPIQVRMNSSFIWSICIMFT